MSKRSEKITKITLADLMKKKEQLEQKKDVKKEVYIPSLDGSIVVRKPDRSLCLESLNMTQDENTKDTADLYLVYNVVVEPNLKDKELQKYYKCIEPYDIVSKLFEDGEIGQIASTALGLAGYNSEVKIINSVKK